MAAGAAGAAGVHVLQAVAAARKPVAVHAPAQAHHVVVQAAPVHQPRAKAVTPMRAVARLMVVGHHIVMAVGVLVQPAVVLAQEAVLVRAHAPTQAPAVVVLAALVQQPKRVAKHVTPMHAQCL